MTKDMIPYHQMVAILTKPGEQIRADLTAEQCHLIHHTLGILGEAGEIVDTVKKHCIYNQPLNRENLIEELGDLEFYLEGLRQSVNISRGEVLDHNQDKLSKRYPNFQYSDVKAKERLDKQ